MKLLIRPRVQRDKWSLYWRTSMATRTDLLDPLELELPPTATGAAAKAAVAAALGWPPVGGLLRLEGFEEPWELLAFKGVELGDTATLQDAGLADGDAVTAVRKVLVAEGAAWEGGGEGVGEGVERALASGDAIESERTRLRLRLRPPRAAAPARQHGLGSGGCGGAGGRWRSTGEVTHRLPSALTPLSPSLCARRRTGWKVTTGNDDDSSTDQDDF